MVRVFANGLRVGINTKDKKKVLDAAMLKIQHYKVYIKGKWSNLGKEVAPWSYWRECPLIVLNCGQPNVSLRKVIE